MFILCYPDKRNNIIGVWKMEEFKVCFYGDLNFGESYQAIYDIQSKKNVLRQKGYHFLLENVKHFFKDADLNIVNLETVLTNVKHSSLMGIKACIHWSDLEIAPPLLKEYGVDVANLGNNHAYDYGEEGLKQTLCALDNMGIGHFGAGLSEAEAGQEYKKEINIDGKKVNLYVLGGYKYREDYDKEFDFYAKRDKSGVNLLMPNTAKEQIENIRKSDPGAYIVVSPHFGFDLQKTIDHQREQARRYIDMGADIVIGHGPHMMNEIEFYKDKTIIYSLGNFMFAADFNPSKIPYSLVLKLVFRDDRDISKPLVCLYPIYTNEIETNYQTKLIQQEQFYEVLDLLCNNKQEIADKLAADFDNKNGVCIYVNPEG